MEIRYGATGKDREGLVTAIAEIRCIDKMRIIEKKGYVDVKTDRAEIEQAVESFFGFSSKVVDSDPE